MKHLVDQDDIHYLVDSDIHGWTWENGKAKPFYMSRGPGAIPGEIRRWGNEHPIDEMKRILQKDVPDPVPVLKIRKKGHGYEGGHNTAARMDWEHPIPPLIMLSYGGIARSRELLLAIAQKLRVWF